MPEKAKRTQSNSSLRQRRRRWSTEAKIAIVEESLAPGNSVARTARHYGVAPNLLFTWRRRYAADALKNAHDRPHDGEPPVSGSKYRTLERQVRELERLLGKATLENEMLRQALNQAQATLQRHRSLPPNDDGS